MGYKIKDHSDKSAVVEPVVALSSKEQFLFFVEEHRGLVWGGILLIVVLIGGLDYAQLAFPTKGGRILGITRPSPTSLFGSATRRC